MTPTWLDNLCSRLSGMITGEPAPVPTGTGSSAGARTPAEPAGDNTAKIQANRTVWSFIFILLAVISPLIAFASQHGDKVVNIATLITAESTPVTSTVVVTVVERTTSGSGIVFSTLTGLPVDGARIELLDAASGKQADVFGDDGVSTFPSTVVSGSTASDSRGKVYAFPAGHYRFPFLAPGIYRLKVTPPSGFIAPSTIPTAQIQSLPGAPYALHETASRSEPFRVDYGQAMQIDFPLDQQTAPLWVRKSADKTVVSPGDFIGYEISVENSAQTGTVSSATVIDTLPLGFHYRKGSTVINGNKADDPALSSDGRTMTFALGSVPAGTTVTIRYVVSVGTGMKPGEATNIATVTTTAATTANSAKATVLVKETLLQSRSIIMGRVNVGSCGISPDERKKGMEGIGIYLEDGTFVLSDRLGMFHFEGVRPGTHVLQLDLDSIPEGYQIVSCEQNNRFAGRAYSQFADLQGGTMWRADFYLEKTSTVPVAPVTGPSPSPPAARENDGTSVPAVDLGDKTKETACTPDAGPAPEEVVPDNYPAELKIALNDGIFNYRLKLTNGHENSRQVKATVQIPPSLLFMNGTTLLNGKPAADPEVNGGVLVFTFATEAVGTRLDLRFQAIMDGEVGSDLKSVGTILLLASDGGMQATYTATSSALGSMDDITADDVTPHAQTEAKKPLEPATDEAESFREQPLAREQHEPMEQSAAWRIADEEGVISPAEDSLIATRINSVRVVLSSALKPALLLDGREITADRIGFSFKDRDSGKTLYTYIGVDFGEAGNHTLQLKGIDPFGQARFDRAVHVARTGDIAEIKLVSADNNVADGRTPVKVRVILLDRDGKPVQANAELAIKDGSLKPLLSSDLHLRDASASMVTVSGDGWIDFQPVTASGLYRTVLAYNKARVEIETYVQPKLRDWILVGIAEGTAGYHTVAGHMENLKASDLQESYYDKERLAFYTKGTIKGEWLLTMAYDSSGKKTGTAGNGLFQTIDPNAFYTLYGDASSQQYEAASARKLFVKIERDQFYALFGDYDSGLSITELARYSRRMTGVKAEYRSRNHELTVFGSETGQSFVRDEIRADGTSGLYRLSRSALVMNSESITIETRDRLKSEVVISSRKLNRFSDYTIDNTAGTLFFKEPVPNRDNSLNPTYIVVEYEVTDAGNDALTYGGRAGTRMVDDTVRIGASYLHEGQVSGGSSLYGLDTNVQLGSGTKFKAEIAGSKRDAGSDRSHGNAYLAELSHLGGNLEGKIYYREQAEGFGLGMQKASEAGTRKFGGEIAYKHDERVTLNSQAYRHYNLLTGAVRDIVEGVAVYSDKQYGSRLGLRYAVDRLDDNSRAEVVQMTAGTSWKTMGERLTLRLDHEQALITPSRNVDFPSRTVIGADFLATRDLMLFAQEELTYGDFANSNNTRIGLKSSPWSGGTVATAVAKELKENGERTYATLGLAQKWQIDPEWAVDGGLDHNRTLHKKAGYQFNNNVPPTVNDEDFTAVSLGANYLDRKIAWSNRAELRLSDREDKWGLVSGLINEQGLNWGWSGKLQLFRNEAPAGSCKTDIDLRFGVAYRPPVTKWIVLERLDLISSDDRSSTTSTRGRRVINNINANYRPDKQSQLSLQYGAKYVLDSIDGADYRGYTDLLGIEGRYDISSRLDMGLRGSILHAWGGNQFHYSLAPSIGFNMMENAWVNFGYNFIGFEDRDFSKSSASSQGPFVQFRFKFDQNSVKNGLKMLNQ